MPAAIAVVSALGHVDRLAACRVHFRVIHAGGQVHGQGDEVLHLVRPVAGPLEEHGKAEHGVEIAARVARHEIGHEVDLFSDRGRRLAELPLEGQKRLDRGLLHPPEHAGIDVFGGHFEQTARVMLGQLADIGRIGTARSIRTPEATKTRLMPGCRRAWSSNSLSGP